MRVEFPIVSFICTALVLLPLPWHWRARNAAQISTIVWLTLLNIIQGVNAIIWGGNVIVRYRIWCDITTRILLAANTALPASNMCVCRHLARISSPCDRISDVSDKRRRMYFEIIMCVVVPIITTVLHVVVEDRRFIIYEDIGCVPSTYFSIAGLLIVYLPLVILSLMTTAYAGVALRWLIHRRAKVRTPRSRFVVRRYVRLVGLCIIETLFCAAMSLFVFTSAAQFKFDPWISWKHVHADWTQIEQWSKSALPGYVRQAQMTVWYIAPFTSVFFFAFFGYIPETIQECKKGINWVKSRVFMTESKKTPALPVSTFKVSLVLASTSSLPAVHLEMPRHPERSSQTTHWIMLAQPRLASPSCDI